MDIEFSKAELPQFEDLKFLGDNYFLLSEEPFWVLDTEGVCRLGDLVYQTTFPKKTESVIILGNGKAIIASSIGSFSISDDENDGDDWSDYYLYKGSGLQEIISGWFDFLFNV